MTKLPSRNSGFDLYRRPGLRRALNAQRLLEAIRRDLERPGLRATLRVRSIRTGPLRRYRLEYDNPVLRCARTSYLTRSELDRLREMVDSSNGLFRLDDESGAI